MEEIGISKLNKDAQSLFDHLFYDKIILLETTQKREQRDIGKQMEIKNKRDEILTFIERNPNSEFDIRVLKKNSEDKEDHRVSLVVRNYKDKPETRIARFVIVLDYYFNSVIFYQWSLNNILIKI